MKENTEGNGATKKKKSKTGHSNYSGKDSHSIYSKITNVCSV